MHRRLIVLLLALCLLAGSAVLCLRLLPGEPAETATRMAALGLMLLDSEEGISVLAVRDSSPADRAGILPGDVLLRADGTRVADILQLEALLAKAQRQMCLDVRRNDEETTTLQLRLH